MHSVAASSASASKNHPDLAVDRTFGIDAF
jgi:hypothetical protein